MSDGGVVLVTGVADGFGRSVALGYGRAGHDVVCADADVVQASRIAAEIEDEGGRAIPIQIDVTTAMDVRSAFERVDDLFGRLDVVVHVAPRSRSHEREASADTLRASLLDTLTSTVHVVRRAQVAMAAGGSIVVVSPPEAEGEPLSAMAAGALERFVFASAAHRSAIRINAVRPSRHASDPTHDANLVGWSVFLGTSASKGVSGTTVEVDLPPPPRIVESLLPEIRAALDDDARQDDWDRDEMQSDLHDDLNGEDGA